MKRRIITIILLLCIAVVFVMPAGTAAGAVYFSVINNKILPLKDATMPKIYDGQIYLPASFFSSDDLGVYSSAGDNNAVVYSGTKTLRFDAAQATVIDQNGIQYYQYSPRAYNKTVYVPAKFVCEFFGLMPPALIKAQPADIIRVRTTSETINDLTFPNIEYIKTLMQSMYDVYTGKPPSPSGPSAPPTTPEPPTYSGVSVYLSFYELTGGELDSILRTLSTTPYKAAFFVTAAEIEAHAGLIRRAVCQGHTLGIRLTEQTPEAAYEEYRTVSAYLFEAAQIRSVLVTALGDGAAPAETMAKDKSLVFWRPTKSYDAGTKLSAYALTDRLSTTRGARESLYLPCTPTAADLLRPFLSHLSQYEYSVRRVTETSVPVMTA